MRTSIKASLFVVLCLSVMCLSSMVGTADNDMKCIQPQCITPQGGYQGMDISCTTPVCSDCYDNDPSSTVQCCTVYPTYDCAELSNWNSCDGKCIMSGALCYICYRFCNLL